MERALSATAAPEVAAVVNGPHGNADSSQFVNHECCAHIVRVPKHSSTRA